MPPLTDYLRTCARYHGLGSTPERSFVSALAALLDAVGDDLDPSVLAMMEPVDQGAGHPDIGLYERGQGPAMSGGGPHLAEGALPARGVVEVKPPGYDLDDLEASDQVGRYVSRYGLVLVTNLHAFRLLGRSPERATVRLESFTLADSAEAFWALCDRPGQATPETTERFLSFLKRVLVRGAPLARPDDVAWLLASYARDARLRLHGAELDDLTALREALEDTLGVHFESERGQRFFRSTVIQTLVYGLFSAWVLWHREQPGRTDAFAWRHSTEYLRVPVLQALFHQLVYPTRLTALGLRDLVEQVEDALNRVDRPAFFARFAASEAMLYFYETFLEAFDPALRKDLGVWYTPPDVVRYMVRRVDTVLREELGLADGLASDRVTVLDPCCGTGAYLVAVLDLLAERFQEQHGALAGARLKHAATARLFGFEILTAPFVVAHLQIGLMLLQHGAPLAEGERAGVYLTNALTGWTPPEDPKDRLPFPELDRERAQADAVKQETDILVVLGNPPYARYAGVAVGEEAELAEAYRTAPDGLPQPRGRLNDLYVRFFRMAERQIAEHTGEGVVCFVSNASWLDGTAHTGMRARYLDAFDRVWIDNLHGDKYRTGKTTPEGEPDPSVFSTDLSPQGIQVGTAIALLARRPDHDGVEAVHYRDLWGRGKRAALARSAGLAGTDGYAPVVPVPSLGLPFLPRAVADDYLDWPRLPDLFPTYFPGVNTKRDDFVVDTDLDRLRARVEAYFDPDVSDQAMAERSPRAMREANRFDPKETRRHLQQRGLLPDQFVPHAYRPMDVRWLYYEPETRLLGEKSPDYFPHVFAGNRWLVSQRKPRRGFSAPQVIQSIGCLDLMDRGASCFPLRLNPEAGGGDLFSQGDGEGAPIPNLSERARRYLDSLLPASEAAPTDLGVEALFYHAVTVTHAPTYQQENEGALQQDWPRLPLPGHAETLRKGATLGRQVADLLDAEAPVPGVNAAGAIDPALRPLGQPEHVTRDRLDPSADFAVTAGWGYEGHRGATMPGQGNARPRDLTPEERAARPEGADAWWGEQTLDVYWNETCRWTNVPERVWAYTLGGYPVIKKWLSYREEAVLGRPLRTEEITHVQHMVRRIAALLRLEERLDHHYDEAKAATLKISAQGRATLRSLRPDDRARVDQRLLDLNRFPHDPAVQREAEQLRPEKGMYALPAGPDLRIVFRREDKRLEVLDVAVHERIDRLYRHVEEEV